jgi:hypothetical protein
MAPAVACPGWPAYRVLEARLGQAGGGAIADVLTGKANLRAAGRDLPRAHRGQPELSRLPQCSGHAARRGRYVGCRHYDRRGPNRLFGFGLSYTKFLTASLGPPGAQPDDGETVTPRRPSRTSAGGRQSGGAALRPRLTPAHPGPTRQLRAFAKSISPRREGRPFNLGRRYFAHYDVDRWLLLRPACSMRRSALIADRPPWPPRGRRLARWPHAIPAHAGAGLRPARAYAEFVRASAAANLEPIDEARLSSSQAVRDIRKARVVSGSSTRCRRPKCPFPRAG